MILWHETAKYPKLNLGFTSVDGRALVVILLGLAGFAASAVILKISVLFFFGFVVLERYGFTIAQSVRAIKRNLTGNTVHTARMDRKRRPSGFYR